MRQDAIDTWLHECVLRDEAPVNLQGTLARIGAKQVKYYESLFDLVSTDKSGSITVEEIFSFRKVLGICTDSIIQVEDWISAVDQSRDGEIQKTEFIVFMHIAHQKGTLEDIEFLRNAGPFSAQKRASSEVKWRDYILQTLEDPSSSSVAGLLSFFIIILILLSVVAYCMETVPRVEEWNYVMQALTITEIVSVAVFTAELVARFVCTRNRLRFVLNIMNIIDLLAIVPFYVDLYLSASNQDTGSNSSRALRVARLTRIARIFKLSRYLSWLRLYNSALTKARFPLGMAFFVTLISLIIFASIIYFAERGTYDGTQYVDETGARKDFQSIFDGLYWAVITVTTVGYGDLTPETSLGRIIGVVALITGVLILAIPISIFSTHFEYEYSELIKRRQRMQQRKREEEHLRALPSHAEAIFDGVNQIYNRHIRQRSTQLTTNIRNSAFLGLDRQLSKLKLVATRISSRQLLSRTASEQVSLPENKEKLNTSGEEDPNTTLLPSLSARPSRTESQNIQDDVALAAEFVAHLDDQDLPPRVALLEGFRALEEAQIMSLKQRNKLRQIMLQRQMQRIVDRRREKLWLECRILERKFRQDIIQGIIERYSTWFIKSDDEFEQEILQAVLRIQRVIRGGMARVVYSTKMVAYREQVRKRNSLVATENPPKEQALPSAFPSKSKAAASTATAAASAAVSVAASAARTVALQSSRKLKKVSKQNANMH